MPRWLPVFGFFTLAACSPTPALVTDAGNVTDSPSTDVALDAALDAGAPRDVVRVEGGACIPACSSGQSCVDGVCEGDAAVGDASADAVAADVWRSARAYQSCEPIGSACGDGLTCLALTAGATRGICSVQCSTNGMCPVACRPGFEGCTVGSETCFPAGPTDAGTCLLGCLGLPSVCPTGTVCDRSLILNFCVVQ